MQWESPYVGYFGGFPKPKVARTCFGLPMHESDSASLLSYAYVGIFKKEFDISERPGLHLGFCNHTRRKAILNLINSLRRFSIQSVIPE